MTERDVISFMIDVAPCAEAIGLLLVAFPMFLQLLNVGVLLDSAGEVTVIKFLRLLGLLLHRRFVLLVIGVFELNDCDVGDNRVLEFARRDPVDENGVVGFGIERLTGFCGDEARNRYDDVVLSEIETCILAECVRNLDKELCLHRVPGLVGTKLKRRALGEPLRDDFLISEKLKMEIE